MPQFSPVFTDLLQTVLAGRPYTPARQFCYKSGQMTNKFDQDAEIDTPAQSQTHDSTPEDVVRKLLETEASSPPHAPTHSPTTHRHKDGHTGDAKHTGTTQHAIKSLVGRLTAAPRRMARNTWAKVRTAILSYQATPRHMAMLLLAIIIVTMPWLIPVLAISGLILVVISYLTLGHDRAAELVLGGYNWFMRRNPQGAEQLRSNAARTSARLTSWAGYLPERWTNGLYLPDFEHPDEIPEKLSGDPFERLAGDIGN